MSTSTTTYTFVHTVTHVTAKMLLLLKDIIREIGLDPSTFVNDWATYERAVSAWLASGHLTRLTLEVYSKSTDTLVKRWDFDVEKSTIGEPQLWVDTDAVRYHIAKAGLAPSGCRYDVKLSTTIGRPDVAGWSSCTFRSTEGLRRYSTGAAVGGDGLSVGLSYWR